MMKAPNKDQVQGPPTVAGYVLDAIRDGILSGRYPEGEKLDQQALADELGVSLIPVRESLRQLEAEGLVRIYPHRGAFVAELSVDELKEIYLIRETLEELATQLAVPNLTRRTLEQLGNLVAQMEQATAAQDFDRLLDLNRSFHFAVYEASRRPLLVQMINGLWDRSTLYRRLYTHLPERAPQALAEHKEIYAACQEGDAEVAGRVVRKNIRQTVEGILAKLGAEGLLGESERETA